ncbi:Lysosomal Pro-X carboxypeptidase [Euphorbia peplus]|nr:Lysosomal Pro-X carboxypeptidase [Euphorbia peplus]
MDIFRYPFLQFVLLMFLFINSSISATHFRFPNFRTIRKYKYGQIEPKISTIQSDFLKDFETFFYTQKLDHFNFRPESLTNFEQRYVMNFKYWGGPNTSAPIFVYFGSEAHIYNDILYNGFLTDNAPHFKALLLYTEHRYYGKSIPFGSEKEALRNASSLGYLNSAQAIADYAAIILHVKKKYSAENSPVIVFGGSYGGMLASWFRLKYPHVALGALAASAPILYFEDIAPKNGYYSVVTKDFRETSESCYEAVRKSWAEIDKVASQPNGLSILSQKFNSCEPLKRSFELKDFLDSVYSEAAQYSEPPYYPITAMCDAIDGAPKTSYILDRIYAGVDVYMQQTSCYDMSLLTYTDLSHHPYTWQTCTELVMPIGHERNTMFQFDPFDMENFTKECFKLFGVLPQPHWVTTYYGGHDIKLILHRFASNIIFSNGLRDPYSSGGVLENISDSILAITTVNGTHSLDLQESREYDPDWLVMQRKTEIKIIQGWISKYYNDLINFKK